MSRNCILDLKCHGTQLVLHLAFLQDLSHLFIRRIGIYKKRLQFSPHQHIEKAFSSHSLSYINNLTVFCYLIIS